jgi:hypothetical protein
MIYKSINLIIVCTFFLNSSALCQSYLTGVVADNETGKPVEFVAVVSGNSLTTTNADGTFILNQPTDSIHLSHVAYEKKSVLYSSIISDTIYLKSKFITLNEIVISDKELNLGNYVNNIQNKYPFDRYTENFFLRISLKKDGQLVKLQDLTGKLSREQLLPTSSKPLPIKLQITEMRKIGLKEKEVYFEMWGLEKVNRVILYIIASPSINDFYEVPANNDNYTKLVFQANKAHPNPNVGGHYIIHKEDGAIAEYQIVEDLSNSAFEERFGVRTRTIHAEIKVSFKKQDSDNKYYLDKAKINGVVELLDGDQEKPTIYEAEYIWITLKNNGTAINKNASVKKDVFRLDHPYNEDFWKKQNILPLTKEMETLIKKSNATDTRKSSTNIPLGESTP